MSLRAQIELAIGFGVTEIEPLTGGCVGPVYRVGLPGGEWMVAKVDERPFPSLHLEGDMLRYLATHTQLPVPAVLHSEPRLLLMEFVAGESHFTPQAQHHAAELLAALHNLSKPQFGFQQNTLIGGLLQSNPWTDSWIDFFRLHRLLVMGEQCLKNGRISSALFARLEKLCGKLETWLEEPKRPSLLHGDVWTTNILAQGNRITGFIDPAIYYGHPEVELAFITLFGTFERPFFDHYHQIRPISPGFFEERCDLYNLYPLLVHTRLFGGSYGTAVERTIHQFGC